MGQHPGLGHRPGHVRGRRGAGTHVGKGIAVRLQATAVRMNAPEMAIQRKITRHAAGVAAASLVWCFANGLPSKAQTDPTPAETPPQQTTTGGRESAGTQRPLPYQFGWQATVITQGLIPFHSPYAGLNSFKRRGEA